MEALVMEYFQQYGQLLALLAIILVNLGITVYNKLKFSEFNWGIFPEFIHEISGIIVALFVLWLFQRANQGNAYLESIFTALYDGAWGAFCLKYFYKIMKKFQQAGAPVDEVVPPQPLSQTPVKIPTNSNGNPTI